MNSFADDEALGVPGVSGTLMDGDNRYNQQDNFLKSNQAYENRLKEHMYQHTNNNEDTIKKGNSTAGGVS